MPSKETWESAQAIADRVAPLPSTSSAMGAVYGLFGGATVASVAFLFQGVDVQASSGASTATGLVCAVAGYLYFKSAENKHSKAFARALEEQEATERYRLKQARWSEEDRARAVVELRTMVDRLLADHPQLDSTRAPATDRYPSTEAANLVGYLMDLGKLGVIPPDLGDQQMGRYGFLTVIPIHPRPQELLRNP